VVVGSGGVASRRLVMVLCGGMFALVSHNRSPGWYLGGLRAMSEEDTVESTFLSAPARYVPLRVDVVLTLNLSKSHA
jgi:hypothetical protein